MSGKWVRKFVRRLLLAVPVILTIGRLDAAELNLLGTNMPPLDFHGFISQGFLGSTKYNYLASDTKSGTFQFTEVGLNVSLNPFPRTRITAQGFLYDMGDAGNYQPFLDYATIEYTFNDYIGLRGGRFRKPSGIYNHIQDVDLARTAVLLPQGIYDSRYRDITAALDGGEVFGAIPLSKAGSLAYELYAGTVSIGTDTGIAHSINNSLAGGKITSFDPVLEAGYQLWWNTPVNGLRFGAALGYVVNLDYNFTAPTGFPPPNDKVALRAESVMPIQQYSAEYVWERWTFQAEYYNAPISQDTITPAGTIDTYTPIKAWYGGAAYRFNKWLEVGGYYTEYYNDSPTITVASDNSQKDAALSFRFDPTDWWIFKVEGHLIHGTALLLDNAANPTRNNEPWFMLAVKTTFSF